MPQLDRPAIPSVTFDIRDDGARCASMEAGFKNTEAIHRTIARAHAAGGGRVVIPAGDWLTGPIHLKSNIELHLEQGAVLRFSEDKQDYLPVVIQRHEGVEAYNYSPLIYAYELENVALTGKGTPRCAGSALVDLVPPIRSPTPRYCKQTTAFPP
jgi:polygalacturonase